MRTFDLPTFSSTKKKILRDALGFELEAEFGKRFDDRVYELPYGFSAKPDGSLRGVGIEYVSKPLEPTPLKSLVTELFDYFKLSKNLPQPSHRTSVHVHLNMVGASTEECLIFIALYYLVEPVLLRMAGPDRSSSPFCVSSDALVSRIRSSVLKSKPFWEDLENENNNKYNSLNLACFPNIGTFECRIMRGLLNDVDCNNWIDTLHGIREAAKKFKSLKELSNVFLETKYNKFIDDIIPNGTRDIVYLDKEELRALERKAYGTAFPILSLHSKLGKDRQSLKVLEEKRKALLLNMSGLVDEFDF